MTRHVAAVLGILWAELIFFEWSLFSSVWRVSSFFIFSYIFSMSLAEVGQAWWFLTLEVLGLSIEVRKLNPPKLVSTNMTPRKLNPQKIESPKTLVFCFLPLLCVVIFRSLVWLVQFSKKNQHRGIEGRQLGSIDHQKAILGVRKITWLGVGFVDLAINFNKGCSLFSRCYLTIHNY